VNLLEKFFLSFHPLYDCFFYIREGIGKLLKLPDRNELWNPIAIYSYVTIPTV
jgi:hypothetical protein